MSMDFLREYAVARDGLLESISASLKQDPRFVAAWLTGSFGRGDFDEISDIDLTVVVSQSYIAQLCVQPETITTRPPKDRLDLFGQFGSIDFAYENNRNAPAGGTATNVMYAPLGLRVDWVLVPEETAQRPENIKTLFSHFDVPEMPKPLLESQEDRSKEAADLVGFFWLMAAGISKYLIRDDGVFVTNWLEYLTGLTLDVERRIKGIPNQYHRGSMTKLCVEPAKQLEQLRHLCERIGILTPQVVAIGGDVWLESQVGMEHWLQMANQKVAQQSTAD